MKEYRRGAWAAFRSEVLRLDGYACTQCAKTATAGAVLHVHHKRYLRGYKPWEYPHDQCATLCAGCHAAEHGHIPPQHGWELVGCDDLGDLSGECERCHTALRYSYLVTHAKWSPMEVGTDCCDEMTGTPEASEHRKHLERRKRFVSSTRWEPGFRGEQTVKQQDIFVTVVPLGCEYRLRMNGQLGRRLFPSEVDAKAAAFDLIESGALTAWLNKARNRQQRS